MIISGLGGIEPGQRAAKYHPLAYFEQSTIKSLAKLPPADLLITHQGPALTQKDGGSAWLDKLIGPHIARIWCHGHSVRVPAIQEIRTTKIVPLHDIAFHSLRDTPEDPGIDGWALIRFGTNGDIHVRRERPYFWREYRKKHWRLVGDVLVSPDLWCQSTSVMDEILDEPVLTWPCVSNTRRANRDGCGRGSGDLRGCIQECTKK